MMATKKNHKQKICK